ncbi:hypothetical protein D3C72_2010870 [compost metagenome]
MVVKAASAVSDRTEAFTVNSIRPPCCISTDWAEMAPVPLAPVPSGDPPTHDACALATQVQVALATLTAAASSGTSTIRVILVRPLYCTTKE